MTDEIAEPEARIEIACRLFADGKLEMWPAARSLGMSRTECEQELLRRGIPLYKPSVADVTADLDALRRLDVGD